MDVFAQIEELKAKLKDRVTILAHHYQRPQIVKYGDFVGDSLELSKKAAQVDSELIVFAGVRFMGEVARILVKPDQKVYLPEPKAGCPLADLAPEDEVEFAVKEIARITGEEPLIVSYVNTSAAVKAITGRTGGSTCTSANAKKVLSWALAQERKVLFISDRNLGYNTAKMLGITDDVAFLSSFGEIHDEKEIKQARLILWNGYCHVHTHFTPQMVRDVRKKYPDAKVIVHPECIPEVVELADEAASTSGIIKYIESSKPGSIIVVGTEANMVRRIANQYPDRKILPLTESICPNMWSVTPKKLLHVLKEFPSENEVVLPEEVIELALKAINQMFNIN